MNNVLILLDNPDDWKPYCETKSILTVSDYLKNKPVEKDRKLVINLSNDYSYNSEGYYCSLLAQTRGQKVIPDVDIINKMEVGTGVRMDRSLQALCYQWIQKNDIKDDIWYLNIYFGKCREKVAMFDARCFNIPKEEVANLLYWRQWCASRNSVQMVGQANFSHKKLQNKTCSDIQDVLMTQKGINWNELPTHQKRGSCCIKTLESVSDSEESRGCDRRPESRRSTGMGAPDE